MIAVVPEVVQEIGAVAGLAAFIGITVLAVVLFVQGRDVRRLRDWAGRAPERDAEFQEATSAAAAERAEEVRSYAGEELPHGDPMEAEARAVQLRAARRKRGRGAALGDRLRMLGPAQIGLAVLAVLLIGGIAYLAVDQFGGDEPQTAQRGQGARSAGGPVAAGRVLDPSQVEVAVLNGTAASGLAAAYQDGVSAAGYQVGAVGNSQSTFADSVVMFAEGHRPEGVVFAREFDITELEPMIEEISAVAEGAQVAVVLGDDEIPSS